VLEVEVEVVIVIHHLPQLVVVVQEAVVALHKFKVLMEL
jgi:hypothetical protein